MLYNIEYIPDKFQITEGVVHLLLQNVDNFFMTMVVGNTFVLIFVSLNQTN